MSGVTPKPSPASRSCMPCHQRKVRCDKKTPCSACIRGKHRCAYPGNGSGNDDGTQRPRKPKSTIADIAGRLQQLEGTLVSLSSGHLSSSRTPVAASPRPLISHEPAGPVASPGDTSLQYSRHSTTQKRQTPTRSNDDNARRTSTAFAGVLRSGNDSSEYVNEILLSRVLEEEDENRPTENPQDDGPPRKSVKTVMDSPIGYPFSPMISEPDSPPRSPLDLLPSRGQASQLWRIFVQNTSGLLCLLHMPTTQVAVFTAVDRPDSAPADVVCLLHAVWFSAITSMWPGEAASVLGRPKAESLSRAKTGFEMALAAANVMQTPTVTALQAIALFMMSLRAHRTSRSDWAFLGLAIRLAQSLGVHRDGTAFPRMSLFEAEMRRRLWWQLQAQDKRAAEDHGFVTDASFGGDSADAPRLPLHVDDSALHPGMTQMPPPAAYFCNATHFLIMAQATLALQRLSREFARGAGEEVRQTIVDELMDRVSPLLVYLNPVIPEQKAALLACNIVLAKRDFVSRVQLLSRHPSPLGDDVVEDEQEQEIISGADPRREDGAESPAAAVASTTMKTTRTEWTKTAIMEASLVVACDILDMDHEVYKDELLRNYRWLSECYPQYHLLLYVLWHLNMRPVQGPNVGRAWAAVDRVFEHEATRVWRQGGGGEPLPKVSAREYRPTGSVWAVFLRLRDSALRARAAALMTEVAASSVDHHDVAAGNMQAVDDARTAESHAVEGLARLSGDGAAAAAAFEEEQQPQQAERWAENPGFPAAQDNRLEPDRGYDNDPDHGDFINWDGEVQDWTTLLADFESQNYGFWGAAP
ncbi:uncharacterized protein B0I36DRAFT_333107 [Microdochium trichocladiopsis]|uniref:Zn(2)-C6 fungal-type domain-containing protein n=1 Tax=Microdochium trichocladiopsis TaxID=1682393 RepID=A0A9P8XXB2_9PEZI|nr:uncharacterized protein B0I36DRAFT_333107 [Microdochium trichocladiopsis]KAH7020745.1 hypothetical protein B0I36DRAFT_333107 [Microdochium trichocladiopsis]